MSRRPHLTLALTTLLHLFTHAYGVILVPLYLRIADHLHLSGVRAAAFIVTVNGVVYYVFSFNAGVLADRYSRKWLLGVGLLGNALAIALMGFTHQYWIMLALAVAAGLFGTLFHPAANSLIPAHYPESPGMVIGLLGAGSGLGFYVGPKYAGWRAETAHWWPGHIADWQRPVVELGIAGVVMALVYLVLAREAVRDNRITRTPKPLGKTLRLRTILIAITLGCRDFSGVASFSLVAVYLQKARGMDVRQTGAIVGGMMLLSMVINPLLVYISPGRRRLPSLAAAMLFGGVTLCTVPYVDTRMLLPVLCLFQTCHLGSYAMSDAAILERVPDALRGRVVGLFLLIAGTTAAASPWVVGLWTDLLGLRGSHPDAYAPIFLTFGILMASAISSVPLIHRLGVLQGTPIEPLAEAMPATVELVG